MGIFDIVKKLSEAEKISISKLERDLGFSRGALYKMGTSSPSMDKVQKIADYFNVTTDYLLGKNTERKKAIELSEIDDALFGETKHLNESEKQELLRLARFFRDQKDKK